MTKRSNWIISILIVAFLGLIFMRGCNLERMIRQKDRELIQARMAGDGFLEIITSQGTKIAEQKATILESGRKNEQLVDEIGRLSRIKDQVTTYTELRVIKEPVTVTRVETRTDTVTTLNDHFEYHGECMDLVMTQLSDSSAVIDSVSIRDTSTVQFGTRRSWFLAPKETVAVVSHSNSCITTTGMNTYVFRDKKTFIERPIVTFFLGALAGWGGSQIKK